MNDRIICRIAAVGDIMLSRDVGRHFSERPGDFDFPEIGSLLGSHDFVFANLENPVALSGEPHKIQDPHVTFRSHPDTLRVVKNLNVTAVFLGNNHMLDYGPAALEDTLHHLDDSGIKHCGAGKSYEDANRPLLLEHQGRKFAVLSTVFIYSASTLMARDGQAGVADYRMKGILRTIRKLKASGHHVIIGIHWGMEYSLYPLPYQRRQAREMIDSGASLILGHGPHYPQGIENYRHGTIVYSLGNFIFDEPFKFAKRSFIYTVAITEEGKTTASTIHPVHLLDHVPTLVNGHQRERLERLVLSLSQAYGTKDKAFWRRVNSAYLSDIATRVVKMKSLKFMKLPPASFYFSIGIKHYRQKLKATNFLRVLKPRSGDLADKLKNAIRSAISLDHRRAMAVWLKNQPLPIPRHWPDGLIGDLKASDPKAFHKFLWSHHFDTYAEWYDSESLFDSNKMNGSEQTRDQFFIDFDLLMDELKVDRRADIRSILEVGCSLGYTLRFLESTKFPSATDLMGIDIDGHAIAKGSRYLVNAKSRVRLVCGDMEELDSLVGVRRFDFTYATGVLSYLSGCDASRVIKLMMSHTDKILALVGLANREYPNSELRDSRLEAKYGNQWTHNFESMITACGGRVIKTRWDMPMDSKKKGLYFVFAAPERFLASRSSQNTPLQTDLVVAR